MYLLSEALQDDHLCYALLGYLGWHYLGPAVQQFVMSGYHNFISSFS
jgi:hypothetical protein